MARPRTPTELLEAKGAYIEHPERRPAAEPKGGKPLGTPPKYLPDDEKKLWNEIRKRLLPGVAKESDRDAFELLVHLTHKMRTSLETMKGVEMSVLTSLWGRFAMTPADRSKVSVEKPPESPLSSFILRRKPAQPSDQVPAQITS